MLLDNIEDDDLAYDLEIAINKGLRIARANDMTFAKFKQEMSKASIVYTGEDAEEDYELYCLALSDGKFIPPSQWDKFSTLDGD